MQSTAKNVTDYLKEVPAERQPAVMDGESLLASIPTPTPEYMWNQSQVARFSNLFTNSSEVGGYEVVIEV